MFDYIKNKIENSKQIDQIKDHVIAFDFDNFFSHEHFTKISSDIEKYKKSHAHEDYPIDGSDPSIVTFENLSNHDIFYKHLEDFIKTKGIKESLLKKFNYENVNDISDITVTFHTEYPHQIDQAHSDQKDSLSTITLQVYLPTNNSLEQYGTSFVNNKKEILHTTKFLPNNGYVMVSNNNSWHKPVLGVERNSLLIRLTINLDYSKTKTIFNYNPDNKTCYAVWNKDMGVLKKQTDWMQTMTVLNMIDNNFENIVVTKKPFSNDLKFLKNLQTQGFEKVLIVFGGYVWKNNEVPNYFNLLKMDSPVGGFAIKQNSELARQAFIINLQQLDQIQEEDTKGKFFSKYIHNFVDIKEAIQQNRFYYHPEEHEQGEVVSWISSSTEISSTLQDQLSYFTPYKSNHDTLKKLAKSTLK
ncbi:MAG: hypothetical protein CBD16_06595 [Betaproteobacteria bacterium TMED156]|nr:MAG: hypothetical protein CBD16_06595 [Betaproteobacteria bacterium TMED156]